MISRTTVYRDGEWLVVPRNASALPPRCLWTGLPTDGETKELTIVDERGGREFHVFGGYRHKIIRERVRLPASRMWKGDNAAKKRALSRFILSITVPLILIGIVAACLVINTTRPPKETWEIALLMLPICTVMFSVIASFVALLIPFLDDVPGSNDTIRVGLIGDTHFWLPNADREYLASAETWPGESLAAQQSQRAAQSQSAAEAWPVILAWIAVAFLIAFVRGFFRALW